MNYYFVNNKLIKLIEEIKEVDLDLVQIHLISIVNSYSRVGKTCTLSTKQFAKECRCSSAKITKSLKHLRDNHIISVHYPKDQAKTHETNKTYIHKDIKAIISGTIAIETGALDLLYQVSTNNKKIGASSESFRDSSSALHETDLESYLKTIQI